MLLATPLPRILGISPERGECAGNDGRERGAEGREQVQVVQFTKKEYLNELTGYRNETTF